ncbi:MAG: methylamine utilization protein MauG [Methylococcaceae bacterium]|nr:MAG: methylamine utilization protein MauG [Methylococcaceae bacterium]
MQKTILVVIFLFSLYVNAMASSELSTEQKLGNSLFIDRDLSLNRNQSCSTCHSLRGVEDKPAAFIDASNVSQGTAVSAGSPRNVFGTLNTPSIAYAAFTPQFGWDASNQRYAGGLFWNGRANTLADQASKPFLNPVEMAMPNAWELVSRLKEKSYYVTMFATLYQLDLKAIPSRKEALPGQADPASVALVFQKLAEALAAFERSPMFHKFNSKYDFYVAGKTTLSTLEQQGLELFNDNNRGGCAACHSSQLTEDEAGKAVPPLFSNFTYDNVGLPRNYKIPGRPKPNLGLSERADIRQQDPNKHEEGKHRVMTLRNIALTPPYGHNGVFTSLEQITHFFNTRDTLGSVKNNLSTEFSKSGWPNAEIKTNLNHTNMGNLMLSRNEEKAIVAFLKTLTDDYPLWGHDPLVPPGTPSPFEDYLPPEPISQSER